MKEHSKLITLALDVQKSFKKFYLSGGTALMLRHNHRISTDLDFFSQKPFSFSYLLAKVKKLFHVEKFSIFEDNIDIWISGIKISFVIFPFSNVEALAETSGIITASDYDIFLNKVYAAGRRVVWKDPYDAAFLWNLYRWPTSKIKRDFESKFPGQSWEIFLGALVDFDSYPDIPDMTKSILKRLEMETIQNT